MSYLYMSGKQVRITSRLSTALTLLAFMFDSHANLQRLSALDPELPASEAVEALDVRYANFLTPKVGQYLPGEHLASTRSIWRYYLVEDYGEVVPLADCQLAAPLVAGAWADQETERMNLSSRLAKFNPPNSAEIIAG